MTFLKTPAARHAAILSLLFGLSAVLAACGDSSSSSSGGGEGNLSSQSGGGEGGEGGGSSATLSSSSFESQTLCFNTGDTIRPNSPIFAYDGVWYPEYDEAEQVERLYRQSPDCRANGACVPSFLAAAGSDRMHAGAIIRVNFVSSGDPGTFGAQAIFSVNPEVAESNWRKPYTTGPVFGVHLDGVYTGKTNVRGFSTTPGVAWVTMSSDGGPHTVEITLPHQLSMRFHGLLVKHDNVCFSTPAPLNKPVMVVVGNSLAHGEGQFMTEETFAWIASRQMGYELINLAIGGSTISPEMISMNFNSANRADLVVVEWGYNDWTGGGIDAARTKFAQVLENVRAVYPSVKIRVIVPFPTKTVSNPGYGCVQPGPGANEGVGVCATDNTTIEDWRQMERDVVAARVAAGDANIAVITPGELGMTVDDLTTDGVHLSVDGAAKFGPLLAAELLK